MYHSTCNLFYKRMEGKMSYILEELARITGRDFGKCIRVMLEEKEKLEKEAQNE